MFYICFDCLWKVGLGRQGVGGGRWGAGEEEGGGDGIITGITLLL